MPKMPTAITLAISEEIIDIMRQGFNTWESNWATK